MGEFNIEELKKETLTINKEHGMHSAINYIRLQTHVDLITAKKLYDKFLGGE